MVVNISKILKMQVILIINKISKFIIFTFLLKIKENKAMQFGGTTSNFFKTQNQNNPSNYGNPFSQVNRTHYLIKEKNLIFSKKVLLENFGECYINFHVENLK